MKDNQSTARGRRDFLPLAGVGLVSAWAGSKFGAEKKEFPRFSSPVTVVKAANYAKELAGELRRGIEACGLFVRGRKVLLKPNMVEFDQRTCINTDVAVVAAAVEVFHQLGAAEVRIGEGPGHRRDTWDLAGLARYRELVDSFDRRFVDLNRDEVGLVKNFLPGHDFYLAASALSADLIVSIAKMKTHHWAGATLTMKNFFGVVPGSVYGWPKNQLHYFGIPESVMALHRVFRAKAFGIVDGIVGMEGNGPIQGSPKQAGVLVMGSDLVAVDATCCRIMGLQAEKIPYLADPTAGNRDEQWVEQRGESIRSVRTPFMLIPEFVDLTDVHKS